MSVAEPAVAAMYVDALGPGGASAAGVRQCGAEHGCNALLYNRYP